MISSFYERIVGASPPPEPNEPKILCVGLCCLDIVQTCRQYPAEDSDQRSLEYGWQRGGNASNTCTVLASLGAHCEFLGTLSAEEHVNFLQNDMRKYKIDFSHCPVVEGIGCPMSTVILSLSTGTRTILHHNPSLPELTLSNFERLNLEEYSWIHFEGRNVAEFLSMMQCVENYNKSLSTNGSRQVEKNALSCLPITISVELESPRPELYDLLPYADVAFISKDFAQSKGFDNMSETVKHFSAEAKSGATIICAWGDRGAMARTPDGVVVQSPAFPPQKVLDTLGAGDTFNAAVMCYLNKAKLSVMKDSERVGCDQAADDRQEGTRLKREVKKNDNIESLECSQTEFIDQVTLQAAIMFGCRVAGVKIGQKGYSGLKQSFRNDSEN